jgi:hypothetical protein
MADLESLLIRTRRGIRPLVLGTALIGASVQHADAQARLAGELAGEYERKATFIYNLISFIDWPADVFRNASDPLRLVILGQDRFNGALDRLAGKKVDQRSIMVIHSASDVTSPPANIVFLAASEEKRLTTVLARYCHAPVLTLSDIDAFANRGGVIGLVMEDKAVRFAVNRTAAGEARLRISSQVLHLAVPLFSAVSPCR